jgi:hypothetical protein
MEWRLFEEGTVPYVSTAEFHHDRERAPHLEQPVHQERLDLSLDCVRAAENWYAKPTLTDLGAGDGGFLTTVVPFVGKCWGYDFTPANLAGAKERGVDVRDADFTVDPVELGTIVTMTEVLEHMADPHAFVRSLWVRGVRVLIASSPWVETDVSHDACHAWAWDEAGYREMFEKAGWSVVRQETTSYFQVILARR